ncbi:MAG: protein NO VEIN domain-containing protein, partial [Terriglobia bacterium]
PEWFQKLCLAMAESDKDFRRTQTQGRRGRIEWVDNPIYVLTESDEILPAKEVHLRSIPKEVLELRASHPEVDSLLRTYKLLHAGLDSEELNKFFTERTHLQAVDYEKICRSVFLPKMRTDVSAPPKPELMAYTRLLQKGPRVSESIWVLTTQGDAKPSNQVFMGTAYSPAEDWQKNGRYSPQIDFLSPEYLDGVPPADVARWKDFFMKVGVKESGERNHVEVFAMALVEEKLAGELSDFVAKNRQQVGYDREARRRTDGALVKLEIKGQRNEQPVQLIGNEPEAARIALKSKEPFWVCVVAGIPEEPKLWIVEDALSAGSFDTLKIDVTQWRTHGRRVE